MTGPIFQIIVAVWIFLAIILFPVLIKVRAPYGRYTSKGWGPTIDNRTAWIFMELPSLVLFTILFLTGEPIRPNVKWFFLSFWVVHYINRVFIFPIRTRGRGKKMPLLIMLLAMFFNLVNAFVNGYWLGYLSGSTGLGAKIAGNGEVGADLPLEVGADLPLEVGADLPLEVGADLQIRALYYSDWLTDPRFIIGVLLFIGGFIINQVADNHLIKLRRKKSGTYSIPTHSLFRYVSCPNFGGEILEWIGFAIMTWSLPGLSFALWTMANLIPRAIHHHNWYRETFPEYPHKRKAIIPGIL